MYHHAAQCSHCLLTESQEALSRKTRLLWMALVIIGGFSIAEWLVALHSHSLALLAESGHMLSDSFVLVLALVATWIARLPVSPRAPFGYRRVEILAALVNGSGLAAIALWIGWESLTRLQSPPDEILSLPMLITAVIGLLVNTVNALLLHRESHNDLNLRGAFLHMVADAISSIGVIVAALGIWAFDWLWADGVISLFVAVLILVGAVPLVWQSVQILLEQTPAHLDSSVLQDYLSSFEGVALVRSLKVWTVAPGEEILWADLGVTLPDGRDRDRLLLQIQTSVQQEFGIRSVMLQMTAAVGMPRLAVGNPLSDNLNRLLDSEAAPTSGPRSSG